MKLLTYGLTNFDTIEISRDDKIFSQLDVWHGTKKARRLY